MKLVVVTGLSGAGKSQALRALEDMGFYCVDNLPPMLIPNMARLCMEHGNLIDKGGAGHRHPQQRVFRRNRRGAGRLLAMNIHYDIIYLNASDELIRRYKETRRAHPMGGDKMLIRISRRSACCLKIWKKRATDH